MTKFFFAAALMTISAGAAAQQTVPVTRTGLASPDPQVRQRVMAERIGQAQLDALIDNILQAENPTRSRVDSAQQLVRRPRG